MSGEDILNPSLKLSERNKSHEKRQVRFNAEILGVKSKVVEHQTDTMKPEVQTNPDNKPTSSLKVEQPEDGIKRTLSDWLTPKTLHLLQGSDSDLESDEELEELLDRTQKLGLETEKVIIILFYQGRIIKIIPKNF